MATILLQTLRINPLLVLNFHTSACSRATPGMAMKKIMGGTARKKRRFSEAPLLPTPISLSKGSHEGKHSDNARRSKVLNKLFMRHITDLMATGEKSIDFLGHGLEVSKVKITPDYRGLKVFWIAKGTTQDELIESILQKNAGFLRHELSTLRVMGEVPKITFVKDTQYAQIVDLDMRLANADFGEDYTPLESTMKLKNQLQLHTPLNDEIRAKIQQLDNDIDDDCEEQLPPMPQGVLGLQHANIMERIKKSITKSKAVHRLDNCDGEELLKTINENPLGFSSCRKQREAFKEFLHKRELLRSESRKHDKNYFPDMEYRNNHDPHEIDEEYFKNMDCYDNDYLSEDEMET